MNKVLAVIAALLLTTSVAHADTASDLLQNSSAMVEQINKQLTIGGEEAIAGQAKLDLIEKYKDEATEMLKQISILEINADEVTKETLKLAEYDCQGILKFASLSNQ